MSKNLIVGYGEVGKAIHSIIGGGVHDPSQEKKYVGLCDEMHVCFPYFEGFEYAVREYEQAFKPQLVVIHSTVPVGTTEALKAVHSPIRGVHPNLEDGVRTMVKYFGGVRAKEASKQFEKHGIDTKCYEDSRLTEAGKLWSTTQYGVFIMLNKYIKWYCEEFDLDFDVIYKEFNESYNVGYAKLGRTNVQRPSLEYMEGEIGGHCVMPNIELFDKSFNCDILQVITRGNKIASANKGKKTDGR